MTIDQQSYQAGSAVSDFLADRSRALHLGSAALMTVGTLMPWASVLFFKVSGSDADHGAPFWAALATLAAVILVARFPKQWMYRTVAIGLPLYVAAEAVYVINSWTGQSGTTDALFDIHVSLQPGLFVTLAAAVGCLACVGRSIMRERAARQ
jgi:xanthine/uracil permease